MTTNAGCARCDELAEEIGQLHAEAAERRALTDTHLSRALTTAYIIRDAFAGLVPAKVLRMYDHVIDDVMAVMPAHQLTDLMERNP